MVDLLTWEMKKVSFIYLFLNFYFIFPLDLKNINYLEQRDEETGEYSYTKGVDAKQLLQTIGARDRKFEQNMDKDR